MLHIEDGWKEEVVNLLNAETDLVGKNRFLLIDLELFNHAHRETPQWIDYITNYSSVKPWNDFSFAALNNKEFEYTIEQVKEFINFLRGFKKYLKAYHKKEQLNKEFN